MIQRASVILRGLALAAAPPSHPQANSPADKALAVECRSAVGALSVSSREVVEPSAAGLMILAKAPVRPLEEPLGKAQITIFSGKCAPLLEAAVFNAIRLSNRAIYRLEDGKVVAWTSEESPFRDPHIKASDVPRISHAEFVEAAYIQARRTDAGLVKHYVGIWNRRGDWLVAEFVIRSDKAATASVRPLLSSRYPLRSISFFPSIDAPSGALTMVQTPPSGIPRIIGFNWWHGNLK